MDNSIERAPTSVSERACFEGYGLYATLIISVAGLCFFLTACTKHRGTVFIDSDYVTNSVEVRCVNKDEDCLTVGRAAGVDAERSLMTQMRVNSKCNDVEIEIVPSLSEPTEQIMRMKKNGYWTVQFFIPEDSSKIVRDEPYIAWSLFRGQESSGFQGVHMITKAADDICSIIKNSVH